MVRPGWLTSWATHARLGASPWPVGGGHPACRHLDMPGAAAGGVVPSFPTVDAATGGVVSGLGSGRDHRVGFRRGWPGAGYWGTASRVKL